MPASIHTASCLGVLSLSSRIPQQFNSSYQHTFVLDTFLKRPCHSPVTFHSPDPSSQLQQAAQPWTLAHATALPLAATIHSERPPGAVRGQEYATEGLAMAWPGEARLVTWEPGRGLADSAWRVASGGHDVGGGSLRKGESEADGKDWQGAESEGVSRTWGRLNSPNKAKSMGEEWRDHSRSVTRGLCKMRRSDLCNRQG